MVHWEEYCSLVLWRGSRGLGGEVLAKKLMTGPVTLLALLRTVVAAKALLASFGGASIAHDAGVMLLEVWM
jgi:hypothetical protein